MTTTQTSKTPVAGLTPLTPSHTVVNDIAGDIMRSYTDPREILARPYRRVVIRDPESGTFTGLLAEFPGCVTQGSTVEETYAHIEEAAASWIEAALELGQTIPDPVEEQEFSGRFALRMPAGLHKAASEMAQVEGTSLNQLIVAAVAERVGAVRLYAELARRIEQKLEIAGGSTYAGATDRVCEPGSGS